MKLTSREMMGFEAGSRNEVSIGAKSHVLSCPNLANGQEGRGSLYYGTVRGQFSLLFRLRLPPIFRRFTTRQ